MKLAQIQEKHIHQRYKNIYKRSPTITDTNYTYSYVIYCIVILFPAYVCESYCLISGFILLGVDIIHMSRKRPSHQTLLLSFHSFATLVIGQLCLACTNILQYKFKTQSNCFSKPNKYIYRQETARFSNSSA